MKIRNVRNRITGVCLSAAAIFSVMAAAALPVSAASGVIGAEKAKEKALSYVDRSAADVTGMATELEWDDGVQHYEVKFHDGAVRYDIDVRADNGAVIGVDKKMWRAAGSAAVTGDITLDKAKEKALAYAGVAAKDATFTKGKLDRDDGVRYYEIEFSDKSNKYEVDLLASDGTVLEYSWKKLKTDTATTVQGAVTAEKAKEIALKHAGISAANATFTKVKQDRDHGVLEYELEFVSGMMEYEYEINASTGAVTDFDVDYIDD